MIRGAIFLLFVVSHAISEECVTNSFEEELDNEFTAQFCDVSLNFWTQGSYSDLSIPGPDPMSTSFISPAVPSPPWSCLATSPIQMTRYGKLEAKIYMYSESGLQSDDIVFLNVYNYDDERGIVGSDGVSGAIGTIETGWHDLTVELNGPNVPESFRGSVSIKNCLK